MLALALYARSRVYHFDALKEDQQKGNRTFFAPTTHRVEDRERWLPLKKLAGAYYISRRKSPLQVSYLFLLWLRIQAHRITPDRDEIQDTPERTDSSYKSLRTFILPNDRTYQQQYADIYFLRLTKIQPAVEQVASTAWDGTVIGGEEAKRVERVLDVRQGELCWVVGTVYFDMPLKPDILDDISKDVRWYILPVLAGKALEEIG